MVSEFTLGITPRTQELQVEDSFSFQNQTGKLTCLSEFQNHADMKWNGKDTSRDVCEASSSSIIIIHIHHPFSFSDTFLPNNPPATSPSDPRPTTTPLRASLVHPVRRWLST